MNTTFEHLCDTVAPQYNEGVKRAKDVEAGAVLIIAVLSAALWASTLLPYLF